MSWLGKRITLKKFKGAFTAEWLENDLFCSKTTVHFPFGSVRLEACERYNHNLMWNKTTEPRLPRGGGLQREHNRPSSQNKNCLDNVLPGNRHQNTACHYGQYGLVPFYILLSSCCTAWQSIHSLFCYLSFFFHKTVNYPILLFCMGLNDKRKGGKKQSQIQKTWIVFVTWAGSSNTAVWK